METNTKFEEWKLGEQCFNTKHTNMLDAANMLSKKTFSDREYDDLKTYEKKYIHILMRGM